MADGRLRDPELRRGPREARVAGGSLERQQGVERRQRKAGRGGTLSGGHELCSCSTRKYRSRSTAFYATPPAMKLFRFRYSSYARKVQMLLDLLRRRYELVEVPYG